MQSVLTLQLSLWITALAAGLCELNWPQEPFNPLLEKPAPWPRLLPPRKAQAPSE
jgi:hypothetical protein